MASKLIAETPFLKELFSEIKEENYGYCILRDYQHLPLHTDGHDIDILVAPGLELVVLNFISNIASRHNGVLISLYENETIIARFCGKDKTWWGVAIDLIPRLYYRTMVYYNEQHILKNISKHCGIHVASQQDGSMVSFLKECLSNGRDRKNYATTAKNNYLQTPKYYKHLFTNTFGKAGSNYLDAFFSSNIDDNLVGELCKRLRKCLFFTNCKRNGTLSTIFTRLTNYANCLPRVISPPGFVVCVLGTDGSGKSSIINLIQPVLEKALHSKIEYRHMRPNLLPSIAKLLRNSDTTNSKIVINPHNSNPSGPIGSILRLTYYSIDYVFGYWLKVYPSLIKRPCLWIFDRYYYDYLIDPYRGRISLPRWVIKTFGLLIPKPDLTLCLGADPAVIHKRKPELPLPEVKRQVQELKRFCQQTPKAIWIDTGCPIEKSVDQALEAITSAMAARYREK